MQSNSKIPRELKNLLTAKQYKILKAYLYNYGINEMVKKLKVVKRDELILQLIYIGKKLAIYELIYCKIYPNLSKLDKKYMAGFNDFREKLIKEIKYEQLKSRKKGFSRKKRKTT
ncbi:hypothetical protein LCGC14_0305780 [marine sediment metagenome]|uniref:Uncharacterized protein n=1 Tax=marine sediment metagenome TaxID=412755 RepID=A0A0F9TTS6_9ZZZZ